MSLILVPMSDPGPARLPWVRPRHAAGLIACVVAALVCGGCQAIGFFAASYEENMPKKVEAEYDGLKGKSYAVYMIADRGIDANYPGLVPLINAQINDRLHDESGASGWIPSQALLAEIYNHPRWAAMPRSELAKQLGVERLVVVELQEFRLNDPGNQYLWEGRATGLVSVLEVDSATPDLYAFERPVDVKFPDKSGYGPQDMAGNVVSGALRKRFVDRACWLFYTHDEMKNQGY